MKALVIVNDGPLHGERCITGLRLAGALLRTDGTEVGVFLVGAAVSAAVAGPHDTSTGREAALTVAGLISAGAEVRAWTPSLLAHSIDRSAVLIGVVPGTSADLAALALGADRLLVF